MNLKERRRGNPHQVRFGQKEIGPMLNCEEEPEVIDWVNTNKILKKKSENSFCLLCIPTADHTKWSCCDFSLK
jgi:hypothetical protein